MLDLTPSIFTIEDAEFGQLDEVRGVKFFRELLWAEARRLGISVNKIHVSVLTKVPDGGIDASVEENISATESGLIKSGATYYQIKTGAAFKPTEAGQIQNELFGKPTIKSPQK